MLGKRSVLILLLTSCRVSLTLEQFLTVVKPKLTSHKGCRTIQCPIKTQSSYMKGGKTFWALFQFCSTISHWALFEVKFENFWAAFGHFFKLSGQIYSNILIAHWLTGEYCFNFVTTERSSRSIQPDGPTILILSRLPRFCSKIPLSTNMRLG